MVSAPLRGDAQLAVALVTAIRNGDAASIKTLLPEFYNDRAILALAGLAVAGIGAFSKAKQASFDDVIRNVGLGVANDE